MLIDLSLHVYNRLQWSKVRNINRYNHVESNSYQLKTIMERKFKQWSSTIPPISTKQTITSHFNSMNIKKQAISELTQYQMTGYS